MEPKRSPRRSKFEPRGHVESQCCKNMKIKLSPAQEHGFQHLGWSEKLWGSHRKAFGRLLDLQIGLLGQLWNAKLASWSAWGLQVRLPTALWAAK